MNVQTANTYKLKVKDIITVVLLALINVVIFFVGSFLYVTPITILLMPVNNLGGEVWRGGENEKSAPANMSRGAA